MGIFEFLKNNFMHALPILIAGAFAVAIIIERTRTLFVSYPMKEELHFFDKIREVILSNRLAEGVALCDRYQTKPVARIVKAALLRAHLPESMIEHGIELAVGEESQSIKKRTTFLSTIANVATLLGLLGTIAGLIGAFEAVGHADPQQKSAMLAAGISTAMNATMLGLGVAIPCMVAFSFLMNRSNRLISGLEHSGIRTIDLLKQRYYAEESVDQSVPSNGKDKSSTISRAA